MICLKTQHFSINRILLLAIGLWPYQRSKLVQLQRSLFFGIVVSFILVQLTIFLTTEYTPVHVIKVFANGLYFTMYAITYSSFAINAQTVSLVFTILKQFKRSQVKQFLEELQHMCDELKDENEIAIIKKYGYNAKRYTSIITLFYGCSMICTISLPFLPRTFGADLLINESHTYRLMKQAIPILYSTDEENHFYLIFFYLSVVITVGGTAMMATGMMFIGYLKHICGMFRISSYRIEKAMTVNLLKNVNLEKEDIISREIIYAIDIHRTAFQFCTLIISNLLGSHFLMIIVAVICLSLNLYAISETALLGRDIEEGFVHLIMVLVIFTYMFLINYAGQEISDHNDDVFSTVYNVRWYVAPLHVQRLILFFLQRGSKAVKMNLGGVFVISLEFFATLTKASISYFTVVYSMQQ